MIRRKRLLALLLVTLVMMFAAAFSASADMGPKPSITLTVKNAPDERYVIDLLTHGSMYHFDPDDPDSRGTAFLNEYSGKDREMIYTLLTYVSEDSMTARIGSQIGPDCAFAEGDGVFRFGYDYVPKEFRVIIVTESGRVLVSEKCTRRAYMASVTYDAAAGTLREEGAGYILPHLISFGVTFFFTLLIEWIVLLLYKYRLRDGKNAAVFLLTNFVTQLGMYLLLQTFASLFMIIVEVLITVTEAFVYSHLLTPKEPRRADRYALTANIASFLLGMPVWFVVSFIFGTTH